MIPATAVPLVASGSSEKPATASGQSGVQLQAEAITRSIHAAFSVRLTMTNAQADIS